MKTSTKFLLAFMLFVVVSPILEAATGEVTKSGSTWTTKVDGNTKYTGSDMLDAIEAACYWVGSGTINVRSSGTVYAPNGLRYVNLRSNQTIDFHYNTMDCKNDYQVYPVKAYKRSNITVKNLHVTGKPRYVLHFSGCKNITLTNITSNLTNGQGIRFEDGSNMTMNGNINLKTGGHSIESMRFNDIYIGKVTVESEFGCGVLFNTSENCNVDEIWAYNCCPDGSYAGFRQANNNGTTHCKFLRAKNCGRGLYVITGSHGTTIDKVDIDDCNQSGISVEGSAYNVRVNSGSVSNTPKAIDLWNGYSDVCVKVNGGSYGDACGSSSSGSYVTMKNRNSGFCLSSNNSNISQYSCNSSESAQQFELKDVGNGYYIIKNRKSGDCLRSNGSSIYQHTCYDNYWTEMFSKQDVGSGYYLLKNRQTNTCLRIGNGSGDNVYLSSCNSSYWSEMFSFSSIVSKSGKITEDSPIVEEHVNEATTSLKDVFDIYPTSTRGNINVNFTNQFDTDATVCVYNTIGRMVHIEHLQGVNNEINLEKLSSGIYIISISSKLATGTMKIAKK